MRMLPTNLKRLTKLPTLQSLTNLPRLLTQHGTQQARIWQKLLRLQVLRLVHRVLTQVQVLRTTKTAR